MFSSAASGKGFRRKAMSEAVPSPGPVHPPMASSNPIASGHQAHRNRSLADLLEPAVDGPPSPEQLRVLNKQVKHRSQLTTSSGSSSLLSSTSERRQSWDRSLENLGLSRNPSQRSSSRDRPDSVQLFSKAIFHRRGKLRRGSSDQSASNNSSLLSAAEIPMDSPKDQHFIQSMFARRRTLRGDVEPSQKKLQISGPYNFQHLTHTQKEALPDLERTNRMELVSEFSNIHLRRGTEPCLKGIPPEGLHFANFSSESLNAQQDPSAGTNVSSNAEPSLQGRHSRADSRQKVLPPTPSSPKWFSKPSPSEDKAGFSPPRSPKSRNDSSHVSPIAPPPRTSSRVSMRYEGYDPLSTTSLDRPMPNGSFRQPSPFILPIPEGMRSLPMPPSEEKTTDREKISRAISTADDVAWPLRNGMGPLPEVPEEDENHAMTRQTQSSTSNHSSLRGSVSVPLLRQMSLAQVDQRSPSNASDTLGRFDLFAAQRALHDSVDESEFDDLMRESWEDDIDYCYEHAAEADFDYAWERPSCDVTRADYHAATHVNSIGSLRSIPSRMLSPSVPEVPALSPASQTSSAAQQEVITPVIVATPVASNFSLPRRKSSVQLQLHRDPDLSHSPPSSARDIQEFKLSPSLLIPNDYHQQMLQYEREGQHEHELDDEYEERLMKFGKSLSVSQARSSTSTMDSRLSAQSIASSRHKSSASTSTAFTRWTGSSTSSWQANGEAFQATIAKAISDDSHIIGQPSMVMLTESEEPYGPPTRQDSGRHVRAHSEANLLMRAVPDTTTPAENKPAKVPLKTRRRARTTSRSHNNPPPQFALFPQIPPTRL